MRKPTKHELNRIRHKRAIKTHLVRAMEDALATCCKAYWDSGKTLASALQQCLREVSQAMAKTIAMVAVERMVRLGVGTSCPHGSFWRVEKRVSREPASFF